MKIYAVDIGVCQFAQLNSGVKMKVVNWINTTQTIRANRQSAAIKQAEKIFPCRAIRIRLITPPMARHPLAA